MTPRCGEYEVIGLRRFHELRPGDVFRAVLTDIRPGEVTLQFRDGRTHTARTLVYPDARIGEESGFRVRENDFEGRIVLEMVRLSDEAKQENLLYEILRHTGLPATPDVLALGYALLAAGIPADAATLQNSVLQRLLHCPLALLHATDSEAQEIARYVRHNSRHRTYHRVNKYTELHVFKNAHETTAILTAEIPAAGRVEVTITQKPGYPVAYTHTTHPEVPFTLLTPPPAAAALIPKRFNFDIRV